jgi:putative PEP-CTERM system histidine kinase
MTSAIVLIGLSGFVITAVLYLLFCVLVISSRRPATKLPGLALWLVLALLVSAVWAAASAYAVVSNVSASAWLRTLDAAHTAAWVLLLVAMLPRPGHTWTERSLRYVLAGGALGVPVFVGLYSGLGADTNAASNSQPVLIALLALPLSGLIGLEQIFRNADFRQRRVLKPLALGVGTIFAINMFVYADAILFKAVDSDLWLARGVLNAAVAPLILLAVNRLPDWERQLFVSRHVVFYTTSIAGAGLYLLAMGIGGFVIGLRGDVWGPFLQTAFLICAGVIFLYGLFSATVRRTLKVFIAKHFYRNRYDYREEWLRLIKTLAGAEQHASLSERSVKALADIIGSERGELWFVRKPGGSLDGHGALGMPTPLRAIDRSDALVRFLEQTHWVVDTKEYLQDPEKYANAFVQSPEHVAQPSIFVPLIHAKDLVGIVRLDRPSMLGGLSFEDHDLLRTAGQQVAIFLAQQGAQEELAETRQFQAFSKLTAFLMHDLKNMLAQQELVVGNARRFKRNPEFIDDAISTLEASAVRMRGVLERLQSASGKERTSRIEIQKLLYEVCNACADREPVPELAAAVSDVRVNMDRDKLHMALVHAIRNAQDATQPDGRIVLRLATNGGTVSIEVADTGVGMDGEFIRDHLFKPFDSTKGARGMGIGAYQIRETLRAAGGDVSVVSERGVGTTIRMTLPLAEPHGVAERPVA